MLPDSLNKMLADIHARRLRDKERFEKLDSDLCQCCHAYGEDKRSLFIDCLYSIHEVIPEAIDVQLLENMRHTSGYYLRICKSCRARFLEMLHNWFLRGKQLREIEKTHDGYPLENDPTRNIPVRINGAITMMNEEEYARYKEMNQ